MGYIVASCFKISLDKILDKQPVVHDDQAKSTV